MWVIFGHDPLFFATRLSDAVSRFHSSAAQSSPSAAAGRLCVTSLRRLHSVSCEQSKGQLLSSSSPSARDDDTHDSLVMFYSLFSDYLKAD